VAEVPGEGAEDRRIDPVELVVGERRDEGQRPLPRLGEAFGEPLLADGGGERDRSRLPVPSSIL
jgi:hypothetical protein